jgi:hypothetical protein
MTCITGLNVHVPTENRTDNTNDSLCEETECHMENFVGDFSVKVGRKCIFKLTIWNESLHEISNDNGYRAVNFTTLKN